MPDSEDSERYHSEVMERILRELADVSQDTTQDDVVRDSPQPEPQPRRRDDYGRGNCVLRRMWGRCHTRGCPCRGPVTTAQAGQRVDGVPRSDSAHDWYQGERAIRYMVGEVPVLIIPTAHTVIAYMVEDEDPYIFTFEYLIDVAPLDEPWPTGEIEAREALRRYRGGE